jgi:carboxymethylenebutenolidase
MDQEQRQQAIELYDRYTHEGMDRRLFMARMTAIGGSAAAASALIATIAADPAAAAIVPADDKRITTRVLEFKDPRGVYGYLAEPRTRSLKPTVMVIHENRGLNDHIRDVARRLAIAGFRAFAPDFLAPSGGTPKDENAAREAIGKLNLGEASVSAVAMLDELARTSRNGKVGAVGFCWGGAFVNRLAVAAGDRLGVGVSYYGVAPDPSEASRVSAPLVIQLAGLDERVNKSAFPWISALRAAGKPVKYFNYEGVNHAFNNDTSAERYNKAASDLAWKRTIAALRTNLA